MRAALRVLAGLALILALAAPAAAQQAERRVALVIGNAAYRSVGALDNPVNDARDMATKLKGLGFSVLRVENGTKPQMERAIEEFSRKLGPDAVSLFYYAGHGLQVNGHNFLVPVDARIESEQTVRLESVDLDAVLDQMSAARSRVNLVILDACRNNPFETRFRSVSGGLASIDAPEGTLIAYATAPGKVAADGQGRNALYTANLLRALDQPGLKVEDVFKRVRIAVSKATGGAQTPWESSSLTGDFYFRPPSLAMAPAAPVPPPAPAPAAAPLAPATRPLSNPSPRPLPNPPPPAGEGRAGAAAAAAAPREVGPLSGRWSARGEGACAARSELTIEGGHVAGYLDDHPSSVRIDTALDAEGRLRFVTGAGDRLHPYLLRLEGKFPDLVLNGSELCRGERFTYRRVQ
ncbi:MAG TPA: caspase domain-containing protein [Stellaceae bacterium]|nr:caspase domain-containing protein [Stellaceae bacterium]